MNGTAMRERTIVYDASHWSILNMYSVHKISHAWHGHAWVVSRLSQMILQQELSYREQIARQLRTQYMEDIYRHNYNVTLKSS